ncbi:MAG: hypothetical protein U0350_43405 [Caldilineaceae bacterium]
MLKASPARFAEHLRSALWTMKGQTRKSINLLCDDLGYALGRESGGGYLRDYLLKGHVPSQLRELETLAKLLVEGGGLLTHQQCSDFLVTGGHPAPEALLKHWFSPNEGDKRLLGAFVVGPPIKYPRQFFGRNRELRRIFSSLGKRPMESTAIIGRRRTGKSSVLHYLQKITTTPTSELRVGQKHDWLAHIPPYRWVFIDFQNAALHRLEALLAHLLTGMGVAIPEPCTLDQAMQAIYAHPPQQPTVVLMDELGVGMTLPELDRSFWLSLRALINHVNIDNLAFIVAAHADPITLSDDDSKDSPFHNVFISYELGPFHVEEAYELIQTSPLPFAEEDVAWILAQSQRWPALVQILCQERLFALETNEKGDGWKTEGLRKIKPFAYLLQE